MPMPDIRELQENLPLIEMRRHLPLAQLTRDFKVVNFKDVPSDVSEYLPNYAQVDSGPPEWMRQDLEAGLKLGVFSQEAVDLLLN